MYKHVVDGNELSSAAIDVFRRLFKKGSQDDGDLPSKSGMLELIRCGFAMKDYTMELPNRLTVVGQEAAERFFGVR
ncbi:hypothetical protein AVT69_gp274 [Pseudomonas phage PhiPA3]|uniref:Uncharacterized protein 276 n=1 Tax=Pseudomonas phage PhiPA3 TaxID=998086 RepID=F8SJM7_BPPA3|nr:hypothetical protein AVT69_gp274 [Pseudomonas phage PhiPA3]AEH03699.1 hypothetical protein [Pseudomonas phage PhiPA3]